MFTLLNIFTPLYAWCTDLGERLRTQDQFHDYYQNFFQDTPVCGHVFLVACVTALALACFYYFVCCNISFTTAKRYVWLAVLCLCFVLITFITPTRIVGNYDQSGLRSGDTNTLLFESAKKTLEDKLYYVDDDQAREEIIFIADEYAQKFIPTGSNKSVSIGMFTMSESVPLQMSLINGLYGILLFFVFSIIFKRFTIHGKAIPF